jgi:integrase
MQQSEPFCFQKIGQNVHAGYVAARPVVIHYKARFDRVAAHDEDDWDGGGRRLCSQRRRLATARDEHGHWPRSISVHPELRTVLDATPSKHLTFLVTATGKPYGGNHFSESFREWCDAAELPKRCTAHGLRKAACRRLAEAGCSANQIASISGHVTK